MDKAYLLILDHKNDRNHKLEEFDDFGQFRAKYPGFKSWNINS